MTPEQLISAAAITAFYVSVFVLITGLIGNCLNIAVFTTLPSFRNKPCGIYFLVSSMVNLGQIFFGLIAYIVEHGFSIDGNLNSTVWCKIKTTTIQSLHLIFLSTVCLAALDQFFSTHYVHSIRQMSTTKLARNHLIYDICLMILHLILSLVYFELRSPLLGCTIYNSLVENYYTFFFYPVLNGLFPVVITIIFSLLAFYNVRHITRRQIPIERRQSDHQLTAMMFALAIAFVSFGLPFIIFRIYSIKAPVDINNAQQLAINTLLGTITGSLAYINYVVSFYVFMLSSTRFRRQVKHLLVKKCWRSLKRLYKKRSPRLNENQIVPRSSIPDVPTIRLN